MADININNVVTTKRKISITEALVELKLYDAKINKALSSTQFVGSKKKSENKVGVTDLDAFVALSKSGYQSVSDLIKNRAAIKSAVVQSNAVTKVEIAGKVYTVAEAIERKNSIEYDKDLLNEMKTQWANETLKVNRENQKVSAQVDKMLEASLGRDSDKKVSESDLATIHDAYHERNDWELVDPLGLYEKIQQLETEIDAFEADVDIRLSISNSVTYIEV